MTFSALIPAAGNGSRLGRGPKAWLELDGRPAFVWAVEKFGALAEEVVVAVPVGDLDRAGDVAAQYNLQVRLVEGGATRQASILRLLEAARCDRVLIQDVARPFVTRGLIEEVAQAGLAHGAAAAFLPVEVPIARIEHGAVVGHFPASGMALFHAPQAFERTALLAVLNEAERSGCQRQSQLQLWLEAGMDVHPVRGEKNNIKLTTPEDLALAHQLTPYLTQ